MAGGQLPVGGPDLLLDNLLLGEPLSAAHMNRAIKKRSLSAIYVTGPGHGGPGLVASASLDGTYPTIR